MKRRTLVVGDIHGALKSLQDVLIKCKYDPDNDRIIFVGDYVDGWGESAELVDYLIGIKNKANFNYKGEPKVIFIRGNHDVWCQDFLNKGWTPSLWTGQGGTTTLNSYVKLFEDSPDSIGDHRDFFNNLEDWFIDEENRIYIHGGWDYKADKFPKSASYPVNAGTSAKECHWDRSLLGGAKSCAATYEGASFRGTNMFKGVYIGHTATASHLPEKYKNLWNVDSGCGGSGKLTVLDVDTEEYWQSAFSKELYPDEKGR